MAQRFKRIAKELQLFNASPVKNIFLDFSENNLAVLHILMIGQRHTPYSRMFLRFRLEFPDDYPLKPPKIALTSSYDRKIHPNVFPGGWICLSTLNVGDSSGWVPSISLSALLITIYSMFTAEMIQIDNTHINERSTKFFPAIMQDTFHITTKLLHDEHNSTFKQIMHNYVAKHKDWYVRKLERLSRAHDGKLLDNYYTAQATAGNFKLLLEQFKMLLPKLSSPSSQSPSLQSP